MRLALLVNCVNYFGCENWWLVFSEERRQIVYESRVVKRILWHRRDEATDEWRRLQNVELYELHCSPNIIRVLKLRRTEWARRGTRVRKAEVQIRFWWGNWMERELFEDQDVDGIIILKWVEHGLR